MAEQRHVRVLIGASIRELRTAIRWSQRDLAARAGLSQSMVSMVERAELADLTFSTATTLLRAMSGRLAVSVDAPFLGDRVRQRDPAHARLSAFVLSRLRHAGWETSSEVEVGGDRSRGWIDILAFSREAGVMLVIELKTEIHDLGRIERTLGWYEREAWAAGNRRAWRPRRVVGCLVLLATEANEQRLAANRPAIDAGFPLRARDLQPMIDDAAAPLRAGRVLALVDPRSRRRAWIRAARIDGRRTPAPYRDYADFVGTISAAPRSNRGPATPRLRVPERSD